MNAITIAKQYCERGWHPVPLQPREKAITIKDWQSLRIEADDVPRHFKANSNVGILTGEPSGWLIDIDLDHALAVDLADEFLPPTDAEFGRPSKPRSHRLYYVTAPIETYKRQLSRKDGGDMLVELRSTRAQTVFPGSWHKDGELITWEKNGEPTEIDPLELKAAVDALADEIENRLGIVKQSAAQPLPHPSSTPQYGGLDAIERARRFVSRIRGAVAEHGGDNHTFHVALVLVHGFNLTPAQALPIFSEWNARCEPPWPPRRLEYKLSEADKYPGDRGYLLSNPNVAFEQYRRALPPPPPEPLSPLSIGRLCADNPVMKPPKIHGLARLSEVCNIVAAPKIGKSWLSQELSIVSAFGGEWMGFQVEQGRTLYVDNELPKSVIASRFGALAEARGIDRKELDGLIDVLPLRGNLRDIITLGPTFMQEEMRDQYSLIILDALYRLLPPGMEENSNSDMAQVFNAIDKYAEATGATIICVHHSSKGVQGHKAITDTGAGAGSISRAADAHLVIREHEQEGAYAIHAACRSFPPLDPFCVRRDFPLWVRDDTLDPNDMKRENPRRGKQAKDTEPITPWTAERFANEFLGDVPLTEIEVLDTATGDGLTKKQAKALLEQCVRDGLADRPPRKSTQKQTVVRSPVSVVF